MSATDKAVAVIASAIPTLYLCPGIDCPDSTGHCPVNMTAAHELLDALTEAGLTIRHTPTGEAT